MTEKGEPPLLQWTDIKKASAWLTSHATDVHAGGLSSKRIANLLLKYNTVQTFDEKKYASEENNSSVAHDDTEEAYVPRDIGEAVLQSLLQLAEDNKASVKTRVRAMQEIGGKVSRQGWSVAGGGVNARWMEPI